MDRVIALQGGCEFVDGHRLTIDVTSTVVALDTDQSVRYGRFHVRGELDASAVSVVNDRVRQHINGFDHVAIDLADVSLIDSAGVRAIERIATEVRESGVLCEIVELSPIVHRVCNVLEVTLNTAAGSTRRRENKNPLRPGGFRADDGNRNRIISLEG